MNLRETTKSMILSGFPPVLISSLRTLFFGIFFCSRSIRLLVLFYRCVGLPMPVGMISSIIRFDYWHHCGWIIFCWRLYYSSAPWLSALYNCLSSATSCYSSSGNHPDGPKVPAFPKGELLCPISMVKLRVPSLFCLPDRDFGVNARHFVVLTFLRWDRGMFSVCEKELSPHL